MTLTALYFYLFLFFVDCKDILSVTCFGDACTWSHSVNTSMLQLTGSTNGTFVLFGQDSHFNWDNTFDLIILQAKFFIYKCTANKNIISCTCSKGIRLI